MNDRQHNFKFWFQSMKITKVPLIYICGPIDPISGFFLLFYLNYKIKKGDMLHNGLKML